MGIEARQLTLMQQYINRGSKVLCLGYPDILVQGDPEALGIRQEEGADSIRRWHGWNGPVWDTNETFAHNGWTPTYIDFRPGPHISKVVDLNNPKPPAFDELLSYDAIFDPGTLEHIFNIGEAWRWTLNHLRPGGTIIHVSPVNAINHGLWSISPTTYADLYGDDLLVHELMSGPKAQRQFINIKGEPHQHARFAAQPELWNIVVARPTKPWAWPIQRKYST